jgi:hypothetical protein
MVWLSSKGSGLKTLHRIYATLPVVETLRQCWVSQFWEEHGVLRWRHAGNLPPSSVRIDSPMSSDC